VRRRRPAATSLHPHSHPRPSVTALADGPPRRSERAAVNDAWKANLTHMMLSPHARRNMAKAADTGPMLRRKRKATGRRRHRARARGGEEELVR